MLDWSEYGGAAEQRIDDSVVGRDLAALARLMRSNELDVCARTHHWPGRLRNDVISRKWIRIVCRRCDHRLQAFHGVKVRLKHWTEDWRIRCRICGDVLSQSGEMEFTRELEGHWYEPVIAAADRGSALVAGAIDRQRVGENRCEQASAQSVRHAAVRLLPSDALSLFRLDGSYPHRPQALSSLFFAQQLFLLAAIGSRRLADAVNARHLLAVWLENRRLQRQNARRQG